MLLGAISAPAPAAVYCVHTSFELASALDDAQSNGENDLVLLEAVTIHVDTNFYAAYSSSENKNLFLLGGYGPGCEILADKGAKTVIDGNGLGPLAYLSMNGTSAGRIQLQRIVWQNGVANSFQSAVEIDTRGELGIGQNAFLHLVGSDQRSTAIRLVADGAFDVQNSVFARNITGPGSNARLIEITSNGTATPHLTGNTFTGNHGLNGVTVAVYLAGSAWSVANNIAYGNFTIYDLTVSPGAELRHNDIGFLTGSPALNDGTVSIDPLFVDADGDYHLQAGSTLIDTGVNDPPGGTGADDFDDGVRVVNIVDVGAFERQDVLFADGFD
jgi:hypothetical protein